jgi:signal transduction histidine kinase
MRERLESAGGELLVSSQPGRGFDVAANLPARDFA